MYFIFYLLFPFLYVVFFVCRLYIGFSFIIGYFLFYICCLGGSMIISRIFIISYDFCVVCDHWVYILSLTYDNPFFLFYVFVLGYGYIILVIWGLLNYLYHRTGIYLFDFFFVCVFWEECKGFFYYP